MEKIMSRVIGAIERLEKMDGARIAAEFAELLFFIKRQVLGQIPSLSAIGGVIAGAWVSSTFTTSPLRARLAAWGLIKGGRRVVSPFMYRALSIILPLLAATLTAYAIHKLLKTYRENELRMNMELTSRLKEEIQAGIREKFALLERARAAGLISNNEFETKKANLYRSYSRTPSKIEELIIGKLTN